MTMRRLALGRSGEEAVVRRLERRGWVILERNWRCRLGEIDVIALDGDVLVFVEVKTRTSSMFGSPEEAVGRRKRAKLARVALSYVKSRGCGERALRFDVVAVEGGTVRHIQDAFMVEGYTL